MVVAIHSLEHLECDSEEATYFVGRHTQLRLPSDCGVAQSGGVTSRASPAAFRTERNALLMRLTGPPCHSIKNPFAILSRAQRRTCVKSLGGILIVGCRFLVFFMPAVRR